MVGQIASFLASLNWSISDTFVQDTAVLSGPLYAVINVIKRVTGIENERVIVIALGVSLLLGIIVLVAAFEPIRSYLYAVFLMFLGALGIHESERWKTNTGKDTNNEHGRRDSERSD